MLPSYRMQPSSHLLLLIPFLQLMTSGDAQCSLDFAVDEKIRADLSELASLMRVICPPAPQGISSLDACVATPVAPGMSRGKTTCLCQCNPVGWATAHCCHLI
ncbi:hypothetical protein HPG69_010362 [Diceros bicornis minor]|uniref:Resistin n=1 Tax=Diceros bicornis minor TaxID=77932 RepID=A0A7J7F7B3_DICBM|nr:hypothetical protein HPG69_010362 [Diceros bicornis minor]